MARLGFFGIAALVLPGGAAGSQLIDRGASRVRLTTTADGSAVLTYRAAGRVRTVRAWGARNALAPTRLRPQVAFHLEYSTETDFSRTTARRTSTSCRPYDGPPLRYVVATCKAADGSYWAAQSWPRRLPNYGAEPAPAQALRELRLSHWDGALAVFRLRADWVYGGRFEHLYGTLSYLGTGVFGFASTRTGVPLDAYGRTVFIDTYNSVYGPGWRRENGVLTHGPTGYFCYGFYSRPGRGTGKGERYRATVVGPGVMPDLVWEGRSPGAFDRAVDALRNAEQRQLGAAAACKPN